MFVLGRMVLRRFATAFNTPFTATVGCLRVQPRFLCDRPADESKRDSDGECDSYPATKEHTKVPEAYDGTFFDGQLPLDKLTKSFQRSSGPGGQHVNKTNSKVILSFHLDSAEWIPRWIRLRLTQVARNRINKEGILRINSEKHRSQSQNLKDASKKLLDMIDEASHVPWRPSAASIRKQKWLKHLAKRKRYSQLKYHSRSQQHEDEEE